MSYYPWGEERGQGTADGRTKFAGYYRDMPGQDYAMARYYSASSGSFWSPDPGGMKNANAANPLTWNRYGYVMGDPVNRTDRRGLCSDQDDPPCFSAEADADAPLPGDGGDTNNGQLAQESDDAQSGSAGAAGGGSLHVTNVAKSGANYNLVASTFQRIQSNIDPDCLAFLQSGGGNLSGYVNDLIDNQLLAVANFTSTIAAFTGTGGTDIPAGTAAIVVNNNGAFFDSDFAVDHGRYKGGTKQADVFILLHELGHALSASGFQADYNNPKAGQANDKLIDQNCGATVKAAGK
jgi:RHS repeat-associated protein